jgi:hypothetical protein
MRINPITLVEIALIVLGIVAFAYKGITYTSRETVIDIGPIHATADTQKTIPLSPLLGGLALVGGIVLVVVGAKKAWFNLESHGGARNEPWMRRTELYARGR